MHHVNPQILHNHPGEILETMVSKKGACIMIYVKMVNITQSFNFNLDTINKRDNQKLLNNFFLKIFRKRSSSLKKLTTYIVNSVGSEI